LTAISLGITYNACILGVGEPSLLPFPDRVLFPGTFLLMWARSEFQPGALPLCPCLSDTAVSYPSLAESLLAP
jgi:hypothetical protein